MTTFFPPIGSPRKSLVRYPFFTKERLPQSGQYFFRQARNLCRQPPDRCRTRKHKHPQEVRDTVCSWYYGLILFSKAGVQRLKGGSYPAAAISLASDGCTPLGKRQKQLYFSYGLRHFRHSTGLRTHVGRGCYGSLVGHTHRLASQNMCHVAGGKSIACPDCVGHFHTRRSLETRFR